MFCSSLSQREDKLTEEYRTIAVNLLVITQSAEQACHDRGHNYPG